MIIVIALYTQDIRLVINENRFRTHAAHYHILLQNNNGFIGKKKATFSFFLTKSRKMNIEYL
jgi:hypothetical protein